MNPGTRRKGRNQASRQPLLANYLIFVDSRETEENYLLGLRDAIPELLNRRLVIRVMKTETKSLVEEAQAVISSSAQLRQPWIVFDRDLVEDFDKIISDALKNGISVGWSNPCIETWFSAYFGNLLTAQDSKGACRDFNTLYLRKTGKEYKKNEKDIYKLLNTHGNQKDALRRARNKKNEHLRDENKNPSEMCPCTTLFELVEEITKTVEQQQSS